MVDGERIAADDTAEKLGLEESLLCMYVIVWCLVVLASLRGNKSHTCRMRI